MNENRNPTTYQMLWNLMQVENKEKCKPYTINISELHIEMRKKKNKPNLFEKRLQNISLIMNALIEKSEVINPKASLKSQLEK